MSHEQRKVTVNDRMQQGYSYWCSAPVGAHFDPVFTPDLTPAEMLRLGVFGGKYLTDCTAEFPAAWFADAKLSPAAHNPALNYFGVRAGLSLAEWRRRGWIYPEDPRGWFQWYCRYYMGRRLPKEDQRQIRRWKAMRRHLVQLQRHCSGHGPSCRPRQRQALLQWGYDTRQLPPS
jgi:hypothetical protein